MKKVEVLVVEDYTHPIKDKEIEEIIKKYQGESVVVNKIHIPKWDIESGNNIAGVYVVVREVAEI